MRWLAAALASALLFVTAATGTLVPIVRPDGIDYVFIQPALSTWLAVSGIAVGTLTLLYLVVRSAARRRSTDSGLAAASGRWLGPFVPLGATAMGLAPAIPGVGEHASVVGYFLYDLRWWWLAGAVVLSAARVDAVVGAPLARRLAGIGRWKRPMRQFVCEAALLVTAIVWAATTTPILRFSAMLHGDEPRYIRQCEAWYEGLGFDVSRVALVADTRRDEPPHLLMNARYFASAIVSDARRLRGDVAQASRHPFTFVWNRATAEDGFVRGIDGGLYQIHQPGVSAILLPGYVLDRYFFATGASADGKFPDALPMTNATMLLVYGLAAVALWRLLARALHSDPLALTWAATGLLTLPATAFAFQFYPELPALVVVLVLAERLLFAPQLGARASAWVGAAAGGLAWFHPRFLLLGLGFLAAAWMRTRGRARLIALAAFAFSLGSLMAYDYHVTGSWLPTALWDATGEGVRFTDPGTVGNFVGYAIDRTWGVLPYAPFLLAAAPGLILLARESPRRALFVGAMTGALAVTAAAHTLSAAGTTPDRLIVAVVPLLVWPAAVFVRRGWRIPAVRALTVIAVVMSLDAALVYNRHHEKPVGPLHAASAVGWRSNLAFPIMRGDVWTNSVPNFHLFLAVALGLVTMTAAGVWLAQARTPRTGPAWRQYVLTFAAVVAAFTALTTPNEDWTNRAFLMSRDAAREAFQRDRDRAGDCRFCFSTAGRHVRDRWADED